MTSLDDNAVSEAIAEATKLKDQARLSKVNLDLYVKAAERFRTAGELAEKLSHSDGYTKETILQAQVFAHYYFYEEHDCLCSASYEDHDLQKARQLHFRGIEHLRSAIKMIEDALPSVSEKCVGHLRGNQRCWEHFLFGEEIKLLGIEARDAWDKGNLIGAIDMYRSMLSKFPKLIEHAEDSKLAPVYKRIAAGNFLGMQANVSNAFCQMFVNRGANGPLPLDLCLDLLRELFTAHQLGRNAFRSNPEWEEYRVNAEQTLNNIKKFLTDNRSIWRDIYLAFEDEPRFLAIMKDVDMKQFKEVQSEGLEANRAVRLWQNGGFWLLAFVIVFGAIFLLATHSEAWWQLAFAVVGIEVLLVLIGVLTLRSVGELSEKGLIALVLIAFKEQATVFSLAKGLFSKLADKDKPTVDSKRDQ